jgi:hypothetical protein
MSGLSEPLLEAEAAAAADLEDGSKVDPKAVTANLTKAAEAKSALKEATDECIASFKELVTSRSTGWILLTAIILGSFQWYECEPSATTLCPLLPTSLSDVSQEWLFGWHPELNNTAMAEQYAQTWSESLQLTLARWGASYLTWCPFVGGAFESFSNATAAPSSLPTIGQAHPPGRTMFWVSVLSWKIATNIVFAGIMMYLAFIKGGAGSSIDAFREKIALRHLVPAKAAAIFDPTYIFPVFAIVHYLYWIVLMNAAVVKKYVDPTGLGYDWEVYSAFIDWLHARSGDHPFRLRQASENKLPLSEK